jgi:VWFA-related protein
MNGRGGGDMRLVSVLFGMTLAALPVHPLCAQSAPPQESSAQFTLNARTVVEDVVVTDKNGRAVTGLRKGDFRVFENGKLQSVTFFESNVDALDSAVSPGPPPANTFTNVPLADAHNVTNVLLLDALNSWPEDRMYAQVQMVKYLASIPPGMCIGIFTLDAERLNLIWPLNQDATALKMAVTRFTSAHSHAESTAIQTHNLLAALDETNRTAQDSRLADSAIALEKFLKHGPGAIEQYNHGALEPFRALAHYLAGIPGRKNLFWIVGNIPWCGHTGECGETMDILAEAGVSVYPIDAHGVDVDMGIGPDPIFHQAAHRFIYSETWAEETGGKAYHANDIRQEIAGAVDHGSRYYTLAYVPADGLEVGRERKVEVKLVSGDYTVSYRRHYLERTTKEIDKEHAGPAKDPLLPQMGHGLPNATGVAYRVTVVPSRVQPQPGASRAGQNAQLTGRLTRYDVGFQLPADAFSLAPDANGTRHVSLQMALMIYGDNFKPLNWEIRTVHLQLNPEQWKAAQTAGISFHTEIDAPPGEVYLRTGVYDSVSSKVGTLEIPLSVVSAEQ